MNTFNRFIITALLVFFTSQAFATEPVVTKVERIDKKTVFITFDQPVELSTFSGWNKTITILLSFTDFDSSLPQPKTTYYLGTSGKGVEFPVEELNPVDGYAQQIKIQFNENSFKLADDSGKNSIRIQLYYLLVRNIGGTQYSIGHTNANFPLAFNSNLAIISANTLKANEGANSSYTLIAKDDNATFSIIENPSNLFSLSGTNNTVLNFNGTNTDFESNTKSYTVKVKATTGDGDDKNAEQTITVNLSNLNDETPTAITLTGNLNITENTTANTDLGTLSATDADAGDTFTYTLENNSAAYFAIDGNTLKLAKTVDYETTKNLNITVRVTDANSHTFSKNFTFDIDDINDETPSDVTLTGSLTIAENTTDNTNLGTLSATDADEGDTFIYTLVNNSAAYFAIDGNTLKLAKTVDYETTKNLNITVRVTDANSHTFDKAFTFNITDVNDETPSDITLTGNLIIIGNTAANTDLGTLSTIDADEGDTFTYTLENNSAAYFAIDGNTLKLAKTVDYETTKRLIVTVRVTDANSHTFSKNFTFTITDPNSNNNSPTDIILSIGNSTDNHTIAENTAANTNLGTLSTTDADMGDTFTYTLINNSEAYFSINGNMLQLAKTVDYETTKNLSITVKVTDANSHIFSKGFDFAITDIDDTAPTDIQLSNKTLVKGQAADTLIGTLSANDVDTATLSFSVSDTTSFKIDGDKLKTKISIDTVGNMDINITADDGTNTPTTQAFTIAVITDIPDITPVIKQFTVTQGNNQGRVISKTGGVVTVHATVIAKTYEWSSVDVTDTSASGDTVFVFDPANTDAGILTITLKATTNAHSSERVLKLELITESVSNSDDDGDGIPNNKDNNTAINKIQAGAGKTITSPTNTRILLGAMGKDSSRLTLAQMQQYITDNNLPNKSSDTSTIGDIYDYVVEGLSATGVSTSVIIELTTAIPANAELRRYSLVTGWADFEVDINNTTHSKTSTTCTDNSTWKAGLTTGATCLMLAIKDGGVNDTDGEQADNTGDANGVVASTISIAMPDLEDSIDPPSSGGSSGGGCVYNPNAPARFDMGFILLMVLSAYYLIRRKRRFV
jgi:mRNA-degrading endonuclease HigB of HigAB toxin-antitoxin module